MRILIVIFSILTILPLQSQDTVPIPRQELDSLFTALDEILLQDSLKGILLDEYGNQIKNYEKLRQQDSLILFYKNQEIGLLNTQIELYNKRLNQVDKWYKKPWIGFALGTLSTIATIHVINYSLP